MHVVQNGFHSCKSKSGYTTISRASALIGTSAGLPFCQNRFVKDQRYWDEQIDNYDNHRSFSARE